MKTKLTATAAATAITLAALSPAPASALTDQEAFLILAGLITIAALDGHAMPAPPPPPPPAAPVTFSTGPIMLKQTFTANFDNGTVGTPGSDLWFQAVDATHRYLKPVHGAKMAVGNRSNRGFAGCSVAHFRAHRVNIHAIPVGSYVCMKTNAGRISQFRVNALLGGAVKKMKLGYTTWQ